MGKLVPPPSVKPVAQKRTGGAVSEPRTLYNVKAINSTSLPAEAGFALLKQEGKHRAIKIYSVNIKTNPSSGFKTAGRISTSDKFLHTDSTGTVFRGVFGNRNLHPKKVRKPVAANGL